jgi:hypothetical protein
MLQVSGFRRCAFCIQNTLGLTLVCIGSKGVFAFGYRYGLSTDTRLRFGNGLSCFLLRRHYWTMEVMCIVCLCEKDIFTTPTRWDNLLQSSVARLWCSFAMQIMQIAHQHRIRRPHTDMNPALALQRKLPTHLLVKHIRLSHRRCAV